MNRPTMLYKDFAFAWMITGISVIRARSEGEAMTKFDQMSRATMLNRATRSAFHRVSIERDTDVQEAVRE